MKKILKIALAVVLFIIIASWIRGYYITGSNENIDTNWIPKVKLEMTRGLSGNTFKITNVDVTAWRKVKVEINDTYLGYTEGCLINDVVYLQYSNCANSEGIRMPDNIKLNKLSLLIESGRGTEAVSYTFDK